MSVWVLRSASEQLAAIARGELSSRTLLEAQLARIDALNPRINAVITLDVERARARADAADAALRRGERWGALHGLPLTVKDCFETAGLRTTAGAKELAGHVPSENATAVQRFVDAGAIVFGKTNTPAWATDWQTHNELFGTTRNPWDLERTPGGSSGGSAAAIAAGFSALELGSDIGGSIRVPAHCCGVFGLKPSWGLVPVRGHLPGPPGSRLETDINVVGPLARSVEDLELALGVLAGPAPAASRAWRLELPPPRGQALGDYRVAAWFDDPACPLDHNVADALSAAVESARAAGASIDTGARPGFDLGEAIDLYRQLLAPLMTLTWSDAAFDGMLRATAGAKPDPSDETAGFLHAMGLRHRDWIALHERRERLRETWAEFFTRYDLLLCPVSPVTAIRHDHREPQTRRRIEVDGASRPYTDQFAWMGPIGVSWLPSCVIPAGLAANGLPVGLQIVAPYLEDRSALDFGRRLAAVLGGHRWAPGFGEPAGGR